MDTVKVFKKDNPDYKVNRHKHLIQITKERYKNDDEFREQCKARSKLYYKNLKEKAGL
jgi:hypothetical protein